MRIQLASDLHLEFIERLFPGERLIAPAADADLLVLAGDIANGLDAVRYFGDWPVPVLYVAGNHEFYGRSWEDTRKALQAAARGTSVVVLDNTVADLGVFTAWAAARRDELSRVRFLGTTLWTDYILTNGPGLERTMEVCERSLVDHRAIRTREGRFSARQARTAHDEARAWLGNELAKPFDGKTVVISHHGPHPSSVHPRWRGPSTATLNAAFVSDLTPLLGHADLWLHGHVHDSFDYTVAGCRVVANPRGYPLRGADAETIDEQTFENGRFQGVCLLEV